MTETELQSAVVDVAHNFGWRVAHFRVARTAQGWRTPVAADGAGWPDLVLAHPDTGRLAVRELKGERGKATDEQIRWLDDLDACGLDTGIWRPADWDGVVQMLSLGRGTVQL